MKVRAGHRCEDCGRTGYPLDAHHCWYRRGFEPWQYPLDALRCLCRPCHKVRPKPEHDWRCLGSRLTSDELVRIRESIEKLFNWYDRSDAMAFLDAIGVDRSKMISALKSMRHNEPSAD